jgi:4-amino-4-deoxy-L-arabinose transferase-like glycosyltransferase
VNLKSNKVLLICIGIFVIAIGIRAVYLESIKHNPFFDDPIMDEKYHDEWGEEIANGNLFGRAPFYRAPAYPYFLGLTYAIFGHGYYVSRVIGIIVGALSCVIIFLLGSMLFSRKIGILAALLSCVYGMFLYFDSMLLTTYLEIVFCLLAFFYTVKWFKTDSKAHLIVAGIFWGLTSITRPNFLVIVPAFVIFVFWYLKKLPLKERLRPVWLMLAGLVVPILIVMVINIAAGNDFVVIAWNGGINFFLGNNPLSNGWSATSPEIDATWWGGYRDAIVIAEQSRGHELLPSQVSNYWFGRGLDYVVRQPIAWLGLMVKKTYLLCNSFRLSNNQFIQTFEEYSFLLRIPLFNFGLILALAIWGIVCTFGKRFTKFILLFLLFYGFSIVLFFVTERYRVPLAPFLLIFSAAAIFWFIRNISNRQVKKSVLAIAAVTIMTVFFNTDLYGTHIVDYSRVHVSLGNRYFAAGDFVEASTAYEKALRYNPHSTDAMNALGNSYLLMDRLDDAREMFMLSLDSKITIDAMCKLGIIYLQSNVMDSAKAYLTGALVMDSLDSEVNYYTGMYYAFVDQPKLAVEYLERSLQNIPDPEHVANIHYTIARLYAKLGEREKATYHLLQAGFKPKEE